MDTLLVLRVLRQYLKVLNLLQLDHLDKLFADLPVLLCDLLVAIQSLDLASFIFKEHVHLADAID